MAKPPAWRTGSRVLPTVPLELDIGVGIKPSECGNILWKSTSKVLPTVVLELAHPAAPPELPFRCQIQLSWLNGAKDGRATPMQGDEYFPTARFAGEQDQFSVALEFAENLSKGTLRLLNPDLAEIQRRIRPGAALEIMESGRVVASCVVENSDAAPDIKTR